MSEEKRLKLAGKIAAASVAVGKVIADKRNHEQGYDYISADAVLARGGDALARCGVCVIPSVTDVEVGVVDRGANRSPRYDARVLFMMLVSDGDEHRELRWIGFGSDYSVPDKAVYKAITSGHKYFLMKLLNIGAGNEDGEHETPDEPPARRQSAGPKSEQEPPAAVKQAAVKQAAIKTPHWPAIAERIAENVPYYMRDGKPAMVHILRAAAAEGFSEITEANAEPLIEALAARVARKHDEARAKSDTSQTDGEKVKADSAAVWGGQN